VTLVAGSADATTGVRARLRVFATHVRRQREPDRPPRDKAVAADVPLIASRIRILELRQRIGRRSLPPVAEPLGEGEVRGVVVRPSLEQLEVDGAPLRKRARADVGEGIVAARRGIVGEVHLLRGFLISPAREHVVHLERHVGSELPLDAGRCLMAVRRLPTGIADLLHQRPIDAPLHEVHVARALQRIVEAWLGAMEPAIEVVADGGEISSAVVDDLILEAVEIAFGLLNPVIRRESEEQTVPAAQRRAIVDLVTGPQPRGDVVAVVRQIAGQPRQELRTLGVRIRVEVVANTEIERQRVGAFQSSCTQPANRWRVMAYLCSVSDNEWNTHRVMGASGATFHVDASFHTGNICWSSAAEGGAAVVASITPLQRRHQMKRLWNRRYSPPTFTS
jgi:hypothetical protein